MTISRRKALSMIGGGVILAAAGTGVHITRKPTKALAPWAAAGQYNEVRKRALSYAILAPNPHNRQPWMVDLATPDQVKLYVDTSRLLPHTDPFSRQITIGQGCFLEVMRMAAAQDGYDVQFDLFPEGSDTEKLDSRPVAIAHFQKSDTVQPDPLFAHIMQRRTQKEPFEMDRPVSDSDLRGLISASQSGTRRWADNSDQSVEHYRKLSEEAMMVEIDTPHTYRESVDLFRIGRAEVNTNPDGIDFSGPLFETLNMFGLFSRKAALDKESVTYTGGIDAVLSNTRTAMAHIWITTKGNTREDQITAGRDWVRLNLQTTALGMGLQPLSQALQEYPEMADHYAQIHKELAEDGETVQMFGRLGYCAPVPESPRWPLEAKIIDA
ncbi:Acg family FMN-binding oxidoreductase [Parasedimentitalea denitrificans]|uniref:Acg family FMN-binding oxidoreductase n=1 Tax=Parasedimentitalea denitrificans TaxID=2211118 RepID=UPI00197E5313|nr:twin-arginine translocation pathway signal protein [Sedimentitalea sp. CY04]